MKRAGAIALVLFAALAAAVLRPVPAGELALAPTVSLRIEARDGTLLRELASRGEGHAAPARLDTLPPHVWEAFIRADRLEEALAQAERVLALTRERGERGLEAWAFCLLGEVASRREPPEVEAAEGHYRQALALGDALGMRPLVAHCHSGFAKLYRHMGKPEEEQQHFRTATIMYREMDMRLWLEKGEAVLGGPV